VTLLEMLNDYRNKSDAAWQQDGHLGFLDEPPSRKRIDYVRGLF
jgi:hypothetical protein